TIISDTGVAQLQLPVEAERPLFRPPVSQPSTNPEPVVWSGQDALETQAALVHYVDHPLVVVLRWLDGTMYTLESWLRSLWKWLLRHL
ncbi:MAG TPA: hypothetical protein IGR64_15470, partial [Leptolyngbyaceae cyanobacterium M65_K2018_010]|nr:hypothetical protein [Leptolyngbyaceae cyanobacterium M65_K2018_010]